MKALYSVYCYKCSVYEFNDLSQYVPHIMHQFSKWNLIKTLWEISHPNFDYFNVLGILYMIVQALCNVKKFG
jgi:hypothetical protein